MKLKNALPWLVLVVLLPMLALSLTAGTVQAGCPCEGGGAPPPPPPQPPVTKTVRVDVSPRGAGDVEVERLLPPAYPVARTVVQGENVYLEATPAEGYYFVGWGGDLSGNESPLYIKMDADKTITAHFFPEEIVSEDNRLHLAFPVGTVVQGKDGTPLVGLEIAINETPLPTPPEATIVGLPYELGPHGTTFDRPVSLSFGYDSSLIPARVAEEELALGYYDAEAAQWLFLPSVVDMASDIITAPIEHLSTFAVIAPNPPPLPAAFTISALNISPPEVDIGAMVTVSVLVTNSGEAEGSYAVDFSVNGALVETREITMAGGSQEVVFSTFGDAAGSYSVEVNGLEGSFTVLEAPLLPLALPGAVIWTILGLAIVALVVSAVIATILSLR
jgi:uncharacterized repeat protein (TIGR02543 family)